MVKVLKVLFTRGWILATILVLLGVMVCIRLGLWQLDRLAQRRAHNAAIMEQMAAPPLHLNQAYDNSELQNMAFRQVVVTGTYRLEDAVYLRNQAWTDEQMVKHTGYHLVIPLVIEGADRAVLIDRGWIPSMADGSEGLQQFAMQGLVTVEGVIQPSSEERGMSLVRDPEAVDGERVAKWNNINIERIAAQVDYNLLPVYVQVVLKTDEDLPHPQQLYVDLTDGSHIGWASQWFIFSALLLFGYPIYVRSQEKGF